MHYLKAFTVYLAVFSFVFLQTIGVYADESTQNYTKFPGYYDSSYAERGMTEFGRLGLETKKEIYELQQQTQSNIDAQEERLMQYISAAVGQQSQQQAGQSPYYMQAQGGFSIPVIATWIMKQVQGIFSFVSSIFASLSTFLSSMFTMAVNFFTSMFDLTLMQESSREDALSGEDALTEELDAVRSAAVEDAAEQLNDFQNNEREYARSKARTLSFIEDGTAGEMCELSSGYGGLSGGFGASLSGAARMSMNSSSRAAQNSEDGSPENQVEDLTQRYRLAVLFCSPADMGGAVNPSNPDDFDETMSFSAGSVNMTIAAGAYGVFCPYQCPGGDGQKCIPANQVIQGIQDEGGRLEKHPGIYNLDTNYTLAIDMRRTWGTGQYWILDEDNQPTILEGDRYKRDEVADTMIAEFFMTHIFREAIPAVPESVFEDAYNPETQLMDVNVAQFLLDHRSLQAYRSVAKNSFINIISRKVPFETATSAENNPSLLEKASEMFLGVKPGDGLTGDKYTDFYKNIFEEMMGEDQQAPSYEGQLEFLAKMLYMHPDFLADTANEENFESKLLVTSATKSIVTHDILQSMMRQEAILATLLEVLLEGKHNNVKSQASAIGSSE